MVRMAMTGGDGSAMWPQDCKAMQDVPNDLVMAVAHAQYILRSSEQLMEDEHPPHWKWAFQDEINAHFERLKRKREAKYSGKSTSDDEEPAGGMAQNELTRNLR